MKNIDTHKNSSIFDACESRRRGVRNTRRGRV